MVKKFGVLLLLGIFMISLTSAFEFDNTYTYNEQTKTATIHNCDIWIGFCLNEGEVLADITLTWGDTRVARGIDQHVGTFNFTPTLNSVDALQELELTNLKNGQIMTRGKQFKVKTIKQDDNYKTECSTEEIWNETNQTLGNSTTCIQVEDGKKDVVEWVPLSNPNFEFIAGVEYEIGVFVDVEKGDRGDWIPKIMGVEIPEWATWTEDLLAGVTNAYKLTELSGNITDSFGSQDGTPTGIDYGQTPLATNLGTSIGFTRADAGDNVIFTSDIAADTSVTVMGWFKLSTASGSAKVMLINGNDGSDEGFGFGITGATNKFQTIVPGVAWSTNGPSSDTSAHSFMLTRNSGTLTLYLDGGSSAVASQTNANSGTYGTDHIFGGNTNSWMDGTLSEVIIFNTVKTTADFAEFDNSGNGLPFPSGTSPTISDINPEDSIISYTQNISFNATVYDLINLTNVSLILDGEINETNTSGINDTVYNFDKVLSLGSHSWSIVAWNNNNLSTQTTNRTITISEEPVWDSGLEQNLHSWYKLDELTGDVLDYMDNSSGTAYNGVIRGTTGIIDKSFTFDGDNDYVNANFGVSALTNFSVSAWVNFSNVSEGTIIGNDDAGFDNSFRLLLPGTDEISINVQDGSSGNIDVGSGINAVVDTWYFVTYTKDGSNHSIYVDGVYKASTTLTQTPNSNDLTIGMRNDYSTGELNGTVDEVGIWTNRVLNNTEILSLYNNGAGLTPIAQVVLNVDTLNATSITKDSAILNGNVTELANETSVNVSFQYVELNVTKFIVAGDLHYMQSEVQTNDTITMLGLLNNETDIDFVVFNGDLAMDNPAYLTLLKSEIFDNLTMPYEVVYGNHDEATEAQWNTLWGHGRNNRFTFENYGFINPSTSDEFSPNNYLCPDTDYVNESLILYQNKTAIFMQSHIAWNEIAGDPYGNVCSDIITLVNDHNAIYDNVILQTQGHTHLYADVYFQDDLYHSYEGAVAGISTEDLKSGYRVVEVTNTTLYTYFKRYNGDISDELTFEYATVDDVDWINTTEQEVTEIGEYNESLSGLTPGATYSFRAVLRNSTDYYYGENLSFTINITNIFIDLLSPADSSTHDTPTVNVSCRAYGDEGVTQLNLTIDGVTNISITNTSIAENLTIIQDVNFSEENYTWGCSAVNPSTSAVSSNRTFEVLYADSDITLFTPVNDSSIDDNSVDFIFNASNINGLENVTLYIDDVANQTNSSGVEGNYSFDVPFVEGNYTWYVLAVSTLGTQTNSTERVFEVLFSSPIINLFTPANDSSFLVDDINFTLNVSDVRGIINVSLFLDGVLNETNSSGTQGNYSFFKTVTGGFHNWSVRAVSTFEKITDSVTRVFGVHASGPTINITAPSGTLDRPPYVNETLIYNISEAGQNSSHFDSCWYLYGETTQCYQESANTTNQTGIDDSCGLSYSGTYDLENNYLYINYLKPENVSSAEWRVKHGRLGESNNTIPISCLNYNEDTLFLRFFSDWSPSVGSYGQCFNGSWNTITSISTQGEGDTCQTFTNMEDRLWDGNWSTTGLYNTALGWRGGFDNDQYCTDGAIWEEGIYWGISPMYDLNCTANIENFTYIQDQNNITVFAEDEFGFISSNTSTWQYLFDYWLIDHITPQYEGTQGVFVLNTSILSGETITEAIFKYNGTNYSTSIISDGTRYLITASIALPSVETDTNFTLSFYVVVDGVTYNFLEETQEILNIDFITCAGIDLLMNISLFDEEFKTPLEGDIEINIQAHSKTSDGIVAELNNTYEDITYQEICLSPNASFSNLYINAEIRYFTDDYATEFYYIQEADLDDYPINLSLFDLNQNDSTEFVVTYKNNAFIFEEGAVIQLQRKYIGENEYETVEAPITSDGGKAILHIDLNSNKYRASIVKDGELLDFFDNVVFSCDNELSGDCTYAFDGTVDPNNDVSIETITDFAYSISVDENLQEIIVLFAVPSGTPSTINVVLEQIDMFGNLTSCNTTIITSAGSITCGYFNTIEKSILELSISKNGIQLGIVGYVNDPELDMDGMNFFIVFLFMLSLVGMAIASPEWMIIISVMVLIISGTMLLLQGMSLVMGLGAIAWVVIAAAIIIMKMAKQEDR